LDLPEVSLVAILDADKEGFLRNERSLVQTVGRAARNINGKVIMYADKMTKSMQRTIDETARRRTMQIEYNLKHNIQPTALNKSTEKIMQSTKVADGDYLTRNMAQEIEEVKQLAAESPTFYGDQKQLKDVMKALKKQMEKAAKDLDFIQAAHFRDQHIELEKLLEK
jgi:excinuclease ABC subunit B